MNTFQKNVITRRAEIYVGLLLENSVVSTSHIFRIETKKEYTEEEFECFEKEVDRLLNKD